MSLSRRNILAAVGVLSLGSTRARAQVQVFDPAAVAQAVKQVSQGLAQIQALQEQLRQQALMVQRLGLDVTGPLRDIAAQATGLLQQAQGLGYEAADLGQAFAQAYPGDLAGLSPQDLAARLDAWVKNSRQTLLDAMQVQNQIVRAQPATSAAVAAAVGASQGAAGQTAVVQATNQLLAALSTQLTQLQTLLISQARQVETFEAERRGIAAKGEADRLRNSVITRPARRLTKDSL